MTYKRVDDNQKLITETFRRLGCSVLVLSSVGHGCPDLLVGFDRVNYLIEIKDGSKFKSAQKLTPLEVKFFDDWKGNVQVINSVDAVIAFVNQLRIIS